MICRLCLKDADQVTHIFDVTGKNQNMATVVGKHFWFEPRSDDPISTVICDDCWYKVSDFHNFYESIQDAQKEFHERFLIKLENQSNLTAKRDEANMVVVNGDALLNKSEPVEEFCEFNESEIPFNVVRTYSESENAVAPSADMSSSVQDSHDIFSATSTHFNSNTDDENSDLVHQKFASEEDKTFDGEAFMKNIINNHQLKELKTLNSDTACERESYPVLNTRITTRLSSKLQKQQQKHDEHQNETIIKSKRGRPRKDYKEGDLSKRAKRTPEELKASKSKNLEADEEIAKYMSLHCELCNSAMNNFTTLKSHMRIKHKVTGYVKCCNKKFLKRVFLLEHIRKHLNPDCYKCEDCDRVFADKQTMRNHFLLKHQKDEDKIYSCSQCPKKFVRKYLMEQHKIHAHLDRSTTCKNCNRRFDTIEDLRMHNQEEGCQERCYAIMCDICAKLIRGTAAFQRHQSEHLGVTIPKVQCEECGSWYKDKYTLNKHRKRHVQSKDVHTCDICQKISPSRPALLSHKRFMHNQKRSFECTICNKHFKKPISLREHMARHTGEVLYRCPHCPKTFNSNANMHAHRKKIHPREFEEVRKIRQQNAHLTTSTVPSISQLSCNKQITQTPSLSDVNEFMLSGV